MCSHEAICSKRYVSECQRLRRCCLPLWASDTTKSVKRLSAAFEIVQDWNKQVCNTSHQLQGGYANGGQSLQDAGRTRTGQHSKPAYQQLLYITVSHLQGAQYSAL